MSTTCMMRRRAAWLDPATLGPSLAQRVADLEARLAVLESALGMSVEPSPPEGGSDPSD